MWCNFSFRCWEGGGRSPSRHLIVVILSSSFQMRKYREMYGVKRVAMLSSGVAGAVAVPSVTRGRLVWVCTTNINTFALH